MIGIPFINGQAVPVLGAAYDGTETWSCDPCGGCSRVYSNKPSYEENAAKLVATCSIESCPLRPPLNELEAEKAVETV